MIKRILVGLGGTHFTPFAIRQAVDLAARREAELTGVTVVNVRQDAFAADEPPESGVLVHSQLTQFREIQERIERSIADFHATAEAAGVTRRSVVLETDAPFTKLIELARFHDLIVCGLKKLLNYDQAQENPLAMLTRFMISGVQPVLSVGETERPMRRALIAFSGSAESTRSMKRFVQMRLFPGIVLRVISFGKPDVAEPLVASAIEYCKAHGYEVEGRVVAAEAKAALLPEAAEYNADVIVLGSSARKTFMRRMLGDTALHIISNANLPLFICQ